ncbi:ABC transporter ATP-binding protein/permease [Promicromonospora iranensis]|uniref:ABC transporter ATP-binding protein/permease n=1 Tax=Promicromonospora iranensis TaxID=1105144 RepID=UPI0023A9647B|nr:ATP-binding cassette domain-containing protein [Promicromonospora iranensis]
MIHRRLLQLAGTVRGAILALAGVGLIMSALHVAFALLVGLVVAALVRGDGDVRVPLTALAVVALVRAAVIWARESLTTRIGVSVRIRLRSRLLDKVAAVPESERRAGRTAATVIDGVDGLDAYYTRYLPQLVVVLVVPAAVVVIVAALAPAAGAVLAVTAAVAVLAPRLWDARLLRNGRGRWEAFTRLSGDYVEALRSIPLLRGFGAAERVGAELDARAEDLRERTMSQLRVSLVESALSALAVHVGVVAAVLVSLAAVATGSTTATTAVLVLMLARECFRPVAELGQHWHAGYLGLTAVDGLDGLLSAEPAVTGEGSRTAPAASGASVELRDVGYRYPGAETGVSGIDLRIGPGETVAVLGPSGAGKSTLARLLERGADPDQGSVHIDGTDLRGYALSALRRSVVVVPQDPVLFAWSVRENLRLYRPGATDAEVAAAAAAADAHDLISALPSGYDTVLAEDGEQLSGGQRQRIAIARALLAEAPVLVLDEVTSALDADTERRVVEGIFGHASGRTTIVIAHRLTAAERCTRWVRIESGRVAATGEGPPTALAQPAGAAR